MHSGDGFHGTITGTGPLPGRRPVDPDEPPEVPRLGAAGQEALVDLEIAFVLPAIADVVAPRQHAPYLGADPERVG
jgi:hypothetical protein